jgi:hypothetical protein
MPLSFIAIAPPALREWLLTSCHVNPHLCRPICWTAFLMMVFTCDGVICRSRLLPQKVVIGTDGCVGICSVLHDVGNTACQGTYWTGC